MPGFLIIGAARSGTTALYRYLSQHPAVALTRPKEPGFFALENERLDFIGPGADYTVNRSVTRLSDYRALFRKLPPAKALGEASTLYLFSDKAPERIHHHVPDVKLIAILRDPVERAYSHFLYARREDREPIHSFMSAVAAEPVRARQRWDPMHQYAAAGLYFHHLSRYFALFPREQIKIFLYDTLQRSAAEVVSQTLRFIGIDDSIRIDTSRRINSSGLPKSRALQSLFFKPNALSPLIQRAVPVRLRERLKDSVSALNLVRPALPAEFRHRLLPYFREDILRLEELIGRDLSPWLSAETKSESSGSSAEVRERTTWPK